MRWFEQKRIAIVALGLIGASLAKALLRAKPQIDQDNKHLLHGYKVLGYSDCADILKAAEQAMLIDTAVQTPRIGSEGNWQHAIRQAVRSNPADLYILCTPVEFIPAMAHLIHEENPQAIISDVGSVKLPIMEACSDLPFIGGHPMAGSERRGYFCSSEFLFENATYALVPPLYEKMRDAVESAYPFLEAFITAIGAYPMYLEAQEHDNVVAKISHMPHVVAAALVHSALGKPADSSIGSTVSEEAVRLAAGGFRDISRIASSDSTLWTGISLESGPALVASLDQFVDNLQEIRLALINKDRNRIQHFFADAGNMRALIPNKGVGPLVGDAQILLNIEDRPGALAELTGILGKEGISIHNLAIQDSRLYEGGQIRIFISSAGEAERAVKVLKEANYDVEE